MNDSTRHETSTPTGLRARLADNDLLIDFVGNKLVLVSSVLLFLLLVTSLFAPWIAPTNPYDPLSLDIMNSSLPPVWQADGDPQFLLGTDDQGRDMLSAILYGLRMSIIISALGVAVAAIIGIALGVVAGYFGGAVDAVIMRIADIQLSFPAILVALLVDGLLHALVPSISRENSASWVIILSIGLSFWVQYARTIRSSTMVEQKKDYVSAARLFGLPDVAIMVRQHAGTYSITSRFSAIQNGNMSETECCRPASSRSSKKSNPRASTKLGAIQDECNYPAVGYPTKNALKR